VARESHEAGAVGGLNPHQHGLHSLLLYSLLLCAPPGISPLRGRHGVAGDLMDDVAGLSFFSN
jgi:hypothetical protein